MEKNKKNITKADEEGKDGSGSKGKEGNDLGKYRKKTEKKIYQG